MCGFGLVHPLPGIADQVQLNTAITLPVGVEAYSAYALGAWLSATTIAPPARRFAAWSASTALALGLVGQVIYHVLEALGYRTAPIPIVVFVSSLPVLALGAAATLHHLTDTPTASDDLENTHTQNPLDVVGTTAAPPQQPRVGAATTTPAQTTSTTDTPVAAQLPAGGAESTATAAANESGTKRTTTPGGENENDRHRTADVDLARTIQNELGPGVKLTRRALEHRMRERGLSCGSQRAQRMIDQLRAEQGDHVGHLEAVS